MAAGRPHNIRPTGPSDIRRVEAGILNWGADFTLENNVYEVGLERLVDTDKRGPYIGREALRRIKDEGVSRKLAGIEIEGARIEFNSTKWPARAGNQVVGPVTSALWSPRLKKNVGYAMLPIAHSSAGTVLNVELPGGDVRRATVVPMPFVDPQKAIPKS